MIVIDTSALVAVLTGEPGSEELVRAIARDDEPCVSAASLAEAGIVLSARYGPSQFHYLQLFIIKAGITVVPVDEEQAVLSVRAYQQYGRGKHRAGLNYGDCFSYALAQSRLAPLLFVGGGFSRTDVTVAPLDAVQ